MHISFCGCGFLGVYHLGVVSSLLRHGPGFVARLQHVAGASSGSLAAAVMVLCPTQQDIQAAKESAMSAARRVRTKPLGALTPGFHLSDDLYSFLNGMLPLDAHERAEGRLHISVTNVRHARNEVVSHFQSRKDLIKVLAASCHIPVYSGPHLPSLDGKLYIDGGWTNNLIRFTTGRTVTVSPFSGLQDISPRDPIKPGLRPLFFTLRNHSIQMSVNNAERLRHGFFPPPRHILQQYFEVGQQEGIKFLDREGFYEQAHSS